jgi:hypothetical protein
VTKPVKTIKVLYSCHACGTEKATMIVPERREGQEIGDFVRQVAQECGLSHSIRSPKCQNRKIDLMLPLFDDAAQIGGAGKKSLSKEQMEELSKQFHD